MIYLNDNQITPYLNKVIPYYVALGDKLIYPKLSTNNTNIIRKFTNPTTIQYSNSSSQQLMVDVFSLESGNYSFNCSLTNGASMGVGFTIDNSNIFNFVLTQSGQSISKNFTITKRCLFGITYLAPTNSTISYTLTKIS